MLKKFAVVTICIAFLCVNAMAQDAKTVIANAQRASGDLKSITYSGTAKDVAFQQCGANAADMICRGTHDPMRPIANYVRVIDLTAPTSRHTGATNNPAGGGATQPMPGTFFAQVTPQQADVSQPWAGSVEFYLTPWGFLKGAAANNATVGKKKVDGNTVLTWSPTVKAPSGKNYVINGYVNEQNFVVRVETWLGDNIMGDMHIVATYSGWKDFLGVFAPTKIVQTRGGWPYFEVDVTGAKPNPADVATLAPQPAPAGRGGQGGGAPAGGPPAGGGGGAGAGGGAGRGGQGGGAVPPAPGGAPAAAPAGGGGRGAQGGAAVPPAPGAPPAAAGAGGGRGGAPAPLTVTTEMLGDGVWRLTTGPGSYDSLVVNFKDYVMLLEAGQSEARALAYIAEIKKLVPGKPIRYVMNTHPHADHTGGLPAMVAEGATIITQKNNEEFFDRALNTPRTLLDDTLAKNPKKAKIESVSSKKVYSDGTHTVEMYHVSPVPHSNGLLIAFLPKEKVLFQGDFSLPAEGQPANDHVKALVPILEKLNLDFTRYINVHTSATPQTKGDLLKAVGK